MRDKKIRKRFAEAEWNVLTHDFNGHKFENHNILREDLLEDILKLRRKGELNYATLQSTIRSWAMYHYWSKCEYEFLVTDLWGKDEEKIDAWRQIEPNLDRLTEYVMKIIEN